MDKRTKQRISNIFVIILVIVVFILFRKYEYNYFLKGIAEAGKTTFSRDSKVTTNKQRSYKVENKDYTDSMFYKKIDVKKFTPYKVSCMVKTNEVQQLENNNMAGAQIVLKGTEEHSQVLYGNNDWTKLEFCFNSKNEDHIQIGFRLGGNGEKAKGTAYFSELGIEEGYINEAPTWKFACIIYDNLDAKLNNGVQVNATMLDNEKEDLKATMKRFKESSYDLSKGKLDIDYDVIEVKEPIQTLTFDESNGYYVGEDDIYKITEPYIQGKEYDHIFACVKMPTEEVMKANNVAEWVGLGNMEYCGRGLSDIKVLEGETDYVYSSSNEFPEEVYLHEFLHTLERNAQEYGFNVPPLHSNETYGYQTQKSVGLRKWYEDYMNKEIDESGTYIGLPEEVFKYKPLQVSDFKYSIKLDKLDEPKNIIGTIQSIFAQIENVFKKEDEQKTITLIS